MCEVPSSASMSLMICDNSFCDSAASASGRYLSRIAGQSKPLKSASKKRSSTIVHASRRTAAPSIVLALTAPHVIAIGEYGIAQIATTRANQFAQDRDDMRIIIDK